ncbi:MerR family transcriptional regulator [Bacillota bacterium Meth-B3]
MAYRIKEVAEMMGITPQTLRFYEQYGMCSYSRGGEGGYRSYSGANVDVLMSLRNLRNCGYGVAQAVELLRCPDILRQSRLLREQAQKLARQIEMQRRIVEKLRERAQWMEEAPARIGIIEERMRPAALMRVFAADREERMLPKERAEMARWTDWMPLLQWGRILDAGRGCKTTRQGFVVDPETAAFLEIGDTPGLIRLPAQPCLYAVLSWRPQKKELDGQVAALLERARAQGKALGEEALVRTFWNVGLTHQQSYGEVWIPVESRSN